MAVQIISAAPTGIALFIDANIFVYGLTGVSAECVAFLTRCENGELSAITSIDVLRDVAHRLMLAEAASRVSPAKMNASTLKNRPALIATLNVWQAQVAGLLSFPMAILDLTEDAFSDVPNIATREMLLIGDSCVRRQMIEVGISAIATNDADFARLGLDVYQPSDI